MVAELKLEDKRKLTWDNKLTGELVTAVFGAEQWEKAHPSVRSMTDRAEFCRYHYREAVRLMEEYVESELKDIGILGVFTDYDAFSYLMLRIRANITAFIQSLHAVADICSHMLYYSLALDKASRPLKERAISAREVFKLLEKQSNVDHPEYEKICSIFCEIITGDGYKCLDALANTSKHRSIVRSELNEDFTGAREERWALVLESFCYAGDFFDKADACEFMKREYDRIQPLVVSVGVELNNILKGRNLL